MIIQDFKRFIWYDDNFAYFETIDGNSNVGVFYDFRKVNVDGDVIVSKKIYVRSDDGVVYCVLNADYHKHDKFADDTVKQAIKMLERSIGVNKNCWNKVVEAGL